MVLTLEVGEPTALAAGRSLVDFSINSGPKLASAYGSQSECHLALAAGSKKHRRLAL